MVYKKSKLIKSILRDKDKRGSIISLVNEKCSNVSIITCKKGSIRSNHYHLKDWHYIYVFKTFICVRAEYIYMLYTCPSWGCRLHQISLDEGRYVKFGWQTYWKARLKPKLLPPKPQSFYQNYSNISPYLIY